jgi:hypothetical protein
MTDIDEVFARAAKEQAEREARLPRNKQALFAVLTAAGVAHVTVDFDGYGDSGQIEDIAFKSGEENLPAHAGEAVLQVASYGQEPGPRTFDVRSAIELLVYELLEDDHGGWELNEGSFGTFTFDVAEGAITLDYNERVETSNHSQHSY